MTMAAKGVAKLIEECGELQQVLGKMLAWWDTDEPHWDGSDLRQRLIDELGDVRAAIELVMCLHGVQTGVRAREAEKLALFYEWHDEPGSNEHGIDGP